MTTPHSEANPFLGFIHRFERSPVGGEAAPTLLLLHGTGGSEHDWPEHGRELLPNAALLSPRGPVLENGMPRFFRRLAEGVFDEDDLRRRTDDLAEFVRAATAHYGLDTARVWALGYSNGANIAASLLLRHPGLLRGAVLLRSMPPLAQPPSASSPLAAADVLMLSGRHDPLVRPEQAETLHQQLRQVGHTVELQWLDAGHQLTPEDFMGAHRWLARAVAPT